jgi:hypothetical protein
LEPLICYLLGVTIPTQQFVFCSVCNIWFILYSYYLSYFHVLSFLHLR